MKKEKWVAIIILILFAGIFLVVHYSTQFEYSKSLLNSIRWAFLGLAILPWIIISGLSFFRSTRESKFFSSLGYVVVIYYGVLLMLFSINKELIPTELPLLNSNSFALGIAIVALGWSLLPQELKNQHFIDEKIKANIENIDKNLESLETRYVKMEDIITNNIIKLGEELKKGKK